MKPDEKSPESLEGSSARPALGSSLLTGGIRFCLASLCVFATVAFAERWMYSRLGLPGAYLSWTVLFILLGGSALHPLVLAPRHRARFYLLFALAFFVYAAGWIGAYFALQGSALGEWAGSLAGSVLMGLVLAAGFGRMQSALRLSFVLFVTNSTGYFLGSALNSAVTSKTGMLLWGGVYGLFLGAGLGAVLYLAQSPQTQVLEGTPTATPGTPTEP